MVETTAQHGTCEMKDETGLESFRMNTRMQPIGIIHSCFKEKFGIPRQPGLAPAAEATLELLPPWNREEAVRGLGAFSHVWILFLFHRAAEQGWKPTVRPPRLGGNRRIGVYASRSPFRPNPIGLSAVELARIERRDGRLLLRLRGVDLLDGTPVLDIKPYISYADSIPDARGGFADRAPAGGIGVAFRAEAERFLNTLEESDGRRLKRLIVQLLEQDPRPAYLANNPGRNEFGMRLFDYNIRWSLADASATVLSIVPEGGG